MAPDRGHHFRCIYIYIRCYDWNVVPSHRQKSICWQDFIRQTSRRGGECERNRGQVLVPINFSTQQQVLIYTWRKGIVHYSQATMKAQPGSCDITGSGFRYNRVNETNTWLRPDTAPSPSSNEAKQHPASERRGRDDFKRQTMLLESNADHTAQAHYTLHQVRSARAAACIHIHFWTYTPTFSISRLKPVDRDWNPQVTLECCFLEVLNNWSRLSV